MFFRDDFLTSQNHLINHKPCCKIEAYGAQTHANFGLQWQVTCKSDLYVLTGRFDRRANRFGTTLAKKYTGYIAGARLLGDKQSAPQQKLSQVLMFVVGTNYNQSKIC